MVVVNQSSQRDAALPRVTVAFLRTVSSSWTPERLRRLVDRPLSNPALDAIEARRKALSALPPMPLHDSYAHKNDHAGTDFVTVKTISLPRRYGRILYSISMDARARCTLEAGAGLGVSGMYLGAASAMLRTGRLISFEVSDYYRIAQESVEITFPAGKVHQDDFANFHRYLDPTTSVDLCFMDSKHDRDTLLRNYKSVLGWMSPTGVLLIDDVMSTPESRLAWKYLHDRDDFGFAACIQNRIGLLAK